MICIDSPRLKNTHTYPYNKRVKVHFTKNSYSIAWSKISLKAMNPNAFSASLFRWDPRSAPAAGAAAPPPYSVRARGLQELFEAYGAFRSYSAAKLAELGFTVNTLLNMRDEELDEMMDTLCHIFRWDLLVAERHTIKAAVGAERRRLFSSRPQQGHFLICGISIWFIIMHVFSWY